MGCDGVALLRGIHGIKGMAMRTVAVIVGPEGADLFDERNTRIELEDDGAGEYVVVKQPEQVKPGHILIGPEEWPALCEAIDKMIKACRD